MELKRHVADCDVVYAAWPHENAFPQLGKPVVCTYHDVTNLEFPEILGGRRAAEEWESSLQWITKSAAVVVISESMRESLLRHFGAVAKRTVRIDHTIFPEPRRSGGLKRSGISATLPERYFVWPANTNSHKNHYSLLVAWSRFPRRAEFPLVLFGDGTDAIAGFSSRTWPANPDHARLAGLIERLGLRPGTDFFALGFVPNGDVAPIIANAYALIAPTLAEGGGGLTVEEALDLGVPVLCSDIPVTREWAANRTADILWFDPYSTDSILSAVDELIEEYDTYKRSALQAMNDPRPSWDDVARSYAEVFRKAVEGNRNGVAN
jgi:glycosyltransferase involved in cell wall biosynthesis